MDEEVKKKKAHCPYCTKEISADDVHCPKCAAAYGMETLQVTQSFVKEALKEITDVQREYDRVPKKFKISYSSPQAFIRGYLSDIGKGGIYIKTSAPLKRIEKVSLKIFLPDGGEELEVIGEVVWSSEKDQVTPKGKYPQGMGIKFLNLTPDEKKRIDRILRHPTT